MATRKRTKAASSMPSLGRLRTTMRSLQRDADKLLKQTRKRAKTLIRQDGEEALERFLGQATVVALRNSLWKINILPNVTDSSFQIGRAHV